MAGTCMVHLFYTSPSISANVTSAFLRRATKKASLDSWTVRLSVSVCQAWGRERKRSRERKRKRNKVREEAKTYAPRRLGLLPVDLGKHLAKQRLKRLVLGPLVELADKVAVGFERFGSECKGGVAEVLWVFVPGGSCYRAGDGEDGVMEREVRCR